jgi:hypothetical protein
MAAKSRCGTSLEAFTATRCGLVCEQTLAGGAGHCNFWFSRLRQE